MFNPVNQGVQFQPGSPRFLQGYQVVNQPGGGGGGFWDNLATGLGRIAQLAGTGANIYATIEDTGRRNEAHEIDKQEKFDQFLAKAARSPEDRKRFIEVGRQMGLSEEAIMARVDPRRVSDTDLYDKHVRNINKRTQQITDPNKSQQPEQDVATGGAATTDDPKLVADVEQNPPTPDKIDVNAVDVPVDAETDVQQEEEISPYTVDPPLPTQVELPTADESGLPPAEQTGVLPDGVSAVEPTVEPPAPRVNEMPDPMRVPNLQTRKQELAMETITPVDGDWSQLPEKFEDPFSSLRESYQYLYKWHLDNVDPSKAYELVEKMDTNPFFALRAAHDEGIRNYLESSRAYLGQMSEEMESYLTDPEVFNNFMLARYPMLAGMGPDADAEVQAAKKWLKDNVPMNLALMQVLDAHGTKVLPHLTQMVGINGRFLTAQMDRESRENIAAARLAQRMAEEANKNRRHDQKYALDLAKTQVWMNTQYTQQQLNRGRIYAQNVENAYKDRVVRAGLHGEELRNKVTALEALEKFYSVKHQGSKAAVDAYSKMLTPMLAFATDTELRQRWELDKEKDPEGYAVYTKNRRATDVAISQLVGGLASEWTALSKDGKTLDIGGKTFDLDKTVMADVIAHLENQGYNQVNAEEAGQSMSWLARAWQRGKQALQATVRQAANGEVPLPVEDPAAGASLTPTQIDMVMRRTTHANPNKPVRYTPEQADQTIAALEKKEGIRLANSQKAQLKRFMTDPNVYTPLVHSKRVQIPAAAVPAPESEDEDVTDYGDAPPEVDYGEDE